ncbi:hypothetical protein ACFJIV_33800 [Mucilaginibacter sp. UC70_90]
MKFAPLQPLQTGAVVHAKGKRIGVEEGKRRKINTAKLSEIKNKKVLEKRKRFSTFATPNGRELERAKDLRLSEFSQ